MPLHEEIIKKDDNIWDRVMEPRLVRIFNQCMLPEIVERRVLKGEKLKKQDYIISAQALQKKQ